MNRYNFNHPYGIFGGWAWTGPEVETSGYKIVRPNGTGLSFMQTLFLGSGFISQCPWA
ncbi:hypothetical protein A33Q_3444 [Indibacter alkaliphilus LW1]|uniref:Uncharacterized protein n=1 Tax=Indibacter alkaliphilus (strain CCUG 57479 / KCTC 22604 / LW1) TaxID=1189612 RepID=S2D8I8_INDAL|nr:hypothetical protein [Indibacter alkaliphilus]EOZ95239.1 hypothetical protein A33Q_3444 [Indibacter alkaliphilus LW1]